jgi:hypothetical protein
VDAVVGVEVGVVVEVSVEVEAGVGVGVVTTAADDEVGAATTRATTIEEESRAIRADEWAAAGLEPDRRIRLLLR